MFQFKRKLNKFKRDPQLFISDMFSKYSNKLKKHMPVKYNSRFQYTVVSAVYNVEKYLDEYFESLVNQSLNFKNHIYLILVDDGSTDNSAKIIKKWQKKYPKNIHYFHKENGGQASARNLGLKHVQTEWVTFIDPDDFVNVDYFKNIDEVLTNNNNIKMLVANTIFYIESNSSFRDTHPLRYRFHQKEKKFAIKDLNKNINLSVAASIFSTKVILDNQIAFDDSVKPNFEDGKFIGEFLLYSHLGEAWFADNVIYNYRKRDDSSSTLDTAWLKPEKYANVLENGFVSLLKKYKENFGVVPTNIQMTALYDMYWYLVYLLNQSEKINFLTDKQKQKYYQLYNDVMQFIDTSTIMNFSMAGAWFFHKVGFLGAFKGEKPPFQICYIESIDKTKQQVLISYFDYFDEPVSYLLDDVDTIPKYQKNVINTFNDKLFVYEKRAWIGYTSLTQTLKINIYGKPARLALSNFAHKPEYTIADIEKAFTSSKYLSDGSWLFMDRETKADDNAEHLYRYLQKNYPEQCCYFALNRDSSDWDRLQVDGFNLVAFGELDFELRLTNCNKIISSHIEAHIHNYFGDLYAGTKQFIFLQHGVTQNNLSKWLNGKKHVASFITTTKDEYQSIAFGEQYKFGQKEVVLTGFPRHDELYRKNIHSQNTKTILIMPTWRSYLMGETIGKGANTRTLNPKFLTSNYATHWLSLLRSGQLKLLVDNYDYQVIFAPHANVEPYLSQMDLPEYVTIWSVSQSDISMQELFVTSSLLITDYSSVHFEMAYIGKPTLYYQFDKDEFFSGKHSLQKGYFNYEEHGFGVVSYDEQSLLVALEDVLKNGIPEEYRYRIDNTFEYQDEKNCERVYQAIKALDKPDEDTVNSDILQEMIDSAYRHQNWKLLILRVTKLLEIEPDNQIAQSLLLRAFIYTKQFDKVKLLLQTYQPQDNELLFLTALIRYNWQQVVDVYPKLTSLTFEMSYGYLNALIKLGKTHQAINCAKHLLQDNKLSEAQKVALTLIILDLQGQYKEMSLLVNDVVLMNNDELSALKPQLLLARAYRELGEYDLAHQQLVNFEKHTNNSTDCRLEIAKLAFSRKRYSKCIDQYEKLITCDYPLTDIEQKQYLDGVFLEGKYDEFLLSIYEHGIGKFDEHQPQIIQILLHQKQWQKVDILKEMVDSAYRHQNWKLLILRVTKLLEIEPDNQIAQSLLLRAFIYTKQFDKVKLLLQTYQPQDNELLFLTALIRYNWQQVVDVYPKLTSLTFEMSYGYLNALIKLGKTHQAINCAKHLLQDNKLSEAQKVALTLIILDLQGQYKEMSLLVNDVVLMNNDELSALKPQLLLARAYRELGEYDLAHQQLVNFEKHTNNSTDCRLEIAKLAFSRKRYSKCIDQYEKLITCDYPLTDIEQKQYLDGVFLEGKYDEFLLSIYEHGIGKFDEHQPQIIQILLHQKQWQKVDILKEMVDSAYRHQNWKLLILRVTKLLEIEPDNQIAQSLLLRAFIYTKQFDKVKLLLQTYQPQDNELLFLTALIRYNWQQVVDVYPKLTSLTFEMSYGYLNALIKLGKTHQAINCAKHLLQDNKLSEAQKVALTLIILDLQGQYKEMSLLVNDVVLMNNDELSALKPQLLLARAYRELGEYDLAHQQLVNFEKHTNNSTDCRLEIAKLAFSRKRYSKCIDQYEKLITCDYPLTDIEQKQYLDGVFLEGKYDEFLLSIYEHGIGKFDEHQPQIIQILLHQKQWQRLDELFVAKPTLQQTMIYEYALSQVRLGKFDKLDKVLPKPIYGHTYEYWQLMVDIAILNDNIALQKHCYKGMVAIFPERDKQENLKNMIRLGFR